MIGALSNVFFYHTDKGIAEGKAQLAIEVAGGNPDLIIPIFIREALPQAVLYVFALTMLSAAMSTLSSLFHVSGSSIGHDIFSKLSGGRESTAVTRAGVCIGIILSLIFALLLPPGIVAPGPAIFFGVCAAAFLPAYAAALYWKRATRAGVWAAIGVGAGVSAFGLLFLHRKESAMLGICQYLTGKSELISTYPWPFVDPFIYALPLSLLTLIVVSLCTAPPDEAHLQKCFQSSNR